MRSANILYKDVLAGVITQQDDGSFIFKYDASWINNNSNPSISLTLPKSIKKLPNSNWASTFIIPKPPMLVTFS